MLLALGVGCKLEVSPLLPDGGSDGTGGVGVAADGTGDGDGVGDGDADGDGIGVGGPDAAASGNGDGDGDGDGDGNGSTDATPDGSAGPLDAGTTDAHVDAGAADAGAGGIDAGLDAGRDAGGDAAVDAGADAGSDAGQPGGPWDRCDLDLNDADCAEGLRCFRSGLTYDPPNLGPGYCAEDCESILFSDCADTGSSVEGSCGSQGVCRLNCDDDRDGCPAGMICEDVDPGGGQTYRCNYPND